MFSIRQFTYTFIVVAAYNNAVAVGRRANKSSTGSSKKTLVWRAAVRVRIATAPDLNLELEPLRKVHDNYKIPAERRSLA
jgi:hypothetical protein